MRTPERLREEAKIIGLCEEVSERWGIDMVDVSRIANAIAQSEIDPLYTIHGRELFVPLEARRKMDARYLGDLEALSVPPDPFEHCTLLGALDQYERDSKNGYWLLKRNPDNDRRVLNNQRAWARFFAVRHPHPVMRKWFEGLIEALENGTVKEWTEAFIRVCEEAGVQIEIGDGEVVSLRMVQR